MKTIAVLLLLCAGAIVLAAGCTGQQPAPPTTIPATTTTGATPAPSVPTPSVTVAPTVVPADLTRTWTLTLMAVRNGTEPSAPSGTPVTLTFWADGTLSGNGGCNDYSADFSLSGPVPAKGNPITIGPITSTKMFCNRVAAQENTYFGILKNAVAYEVVINTLRITASDGTYLSFAAGKQ